MNIKTTHLAFVLFVLLSSSCSTEISTKDNTLPDGKYPLTFTSSVEAMVETRANTTDGGWPADDRIAVRVVGEDEVNEDSYGNVATFTVVSGDPFYWTSSEETKSVSAWYCGTGYSGSLPETWSVQSDQSNNGYQQSDFLYALAQEIMFSDVSKSLAFYHQTARVVINIKKADAATNADQINSVVIGYTDNLALSGTYTAPMGTGVTVGTWAPVTNGSGMGTIIPKDITASGSDILKTYTALVIPQNMQNKEFFVITLSDSKVYYYTPTGSNEAKLESGQVYTYNVTVKNEKIDVVTVDDSSGSWDGGGGGSEDITSTPIP